MIMETIIGLKDKVSKDVSKMRVESALSSRQEKAKWRQLNKFNGKHMWQKI